MKKIILLILMFLLSILTLSENKKTNQSKAISKNVKVEIYFIRHGKTMFNTTNQVQGWSDTPLTNVGIEQAKQAGKGLSEIKFVKAYSSDLGRAINTARLILANNSEKKKPEIIELIGLREWGYGGYEGRDDADLWIPLYKEVNVKFEKDWSTWDEFTSKMDDKAIADAIAKNDSTKTAETYDQILIRSKAAMDQIIEEATAIGGGKVLVVSHGSEIPTILEMYAPDEYNGEAIGNVSLSILEYQNGKFTLKTIGNLDYLK